VICERHCVCLISKIRKALISLRQPRKNYLKNPRRVSKKSEMEFLRWLKDMVWKGGMEMRMVDDEDSFMQNADLGEIHENVDLGEEKAFEALQGEPKVGNGTNGSRHE